MSDNEIIINNIWLTICIYPCEISKKILKSAVLKNYPNKLIYLFLGVIASKSKINQIHKNNMKYYVIFEDGINT